MATSFVKDEQGKWHYRIIGKNGVVVYESEPFESREACMEAYIATLDEE